MKLNDYQQLAMRTAPKFYDYFDGVENAALGLCGESGEIIDLIKKVKYQGHPFNSATKKELIKEAGDQLWYIALLCESLGITLEDAATINIEKLRKRYPGEGFEVERSLNRDE